MRSIVQCLSFIFFILPLFIQNQDNPYAEYSYELFDHYLQKELQISQSETAKYSYSNLGAGLLAYGLSKRRENLWRKSRRQ